MPQDDHSPVLEALALNYITFGFQSLANNLWLWITAVTTAAISFWGTHDTSTTTASPQDLIPPITLEDERLQLLAPTFRATAPPTSIFDAGNTMGRTSGKFSVYFAVSEEEKEEMEMEVGLEEELDSGAKNSSFGKEEEWETRLRMRMDLSWYRFQDLTVMNGNVVKVWDGRWAM